MQEHATTDNLSGTAEPPLPERRIDISDGRPELIRHENEIVLDHWLDLRGARPAPLRIDFNPMRLPRLLPQLMMIEPEDLQDGIIRSFGSDLVRRVGTDLTGSRVSDLYSAMGLQRFRYLMGIMQRERVIAVYYTSYTTGSGRLFVTENLWLPFFDEDGKLSRILGSLWDLDDTQAGRLEPMGGTPGEKQQFNERRAYRL